MALMTIAIVVLSARYTAADITATDIDCLSIFNSSDRNQMSYISWVSLYDYQNDRIAALATETVIARTDIDQIILFHEKDQGTRGVDMLVGLLSKRYIQVELSSVYPNMSCDGLVTNEDRYKAENTTFLFWGSQAVAIQLLTCIQGWELIGPLYNWLLVIPFDAVELLASGVLRAGDRVVVIDTTFNGPVVPTAQICSHLVENRCVPVWRFGLKRFADIGKWTTTVGLNITSNIFPPFQGFFGKEFKIAALPAQLVQFRFVINGTVHYAGYFFEILNSLAHKLKFRYTVLEPADGNYGAPQPDGSWNGIIGMIHRKEVDFGVGPFTISAERKTVVDFLTSLKREKLGLLMRRPNYNPIKSPFLAMKPFRTQVWLCWIMSIAVCALVIWFISRIVMHNFKMNDFFSWSKWDHKLFVHSLWYSMGMSIAQGGSMPSNKSSVLAAVGLMWSTYIIIIATYNSNLVAFLTVTMISLPINSLEELVNQNDYKVGTIANSAHSTIFQGAQSGIFQDVWKRMNDYPDNMVSSESYGVMKALEEKYIFITEGTLINLMSGINYNITAPKLRFFPRDLGFPIQRGSPYQRIFNNVLLTMHETGLITKWKAQYLTARRTNQDTTRTDAERLALTSLNGPFYLLAIGLGLGLMSCAIEIIIQRQTRTIRVQPLQTSTDMVKWHRHHIT